MTTAAFRFWTAFWVLTLLVAAGTVLASSSRSHRASARARAELAAFAQIARDSSELVRLRAGVQRDPDGLQDSEKIAPAVSSALAACGLPPAALSSLSPESESTEPAGTARDARIIRKRATLVLTPVTLPQLGRFLQTWRERCPEWVVSRLDVEPRAGGTGEAGAPSPGSDLPLRVVVGIESLNLEHTRAPR